MKKIFGKVVIFIGMLLIIGYLSIILVVLLEPDGHGIDVAVDLTGHYAIQDGLFEDKLMWVDQSGEQETLFSSKKIKNYVVDSDGIILNTSDGRYYLQYKDNKVIPYY